VDKNMDSQQRSRMIGGLTLILVGLALFVIQFVEQIGQSMILLGIGVLLILVYLLSKNYAFLVPGGVLTGLSLGFVADRYITTEGDLSLVGLGVGFIAVYLIALSYERSSHWWPLIPGGVLILVGLPTGNEMVNYVFTYGWPLALVLVGVLVLFGKFKSPKKDKDGF
jgi:hypothetical protein